MSINTPDVHESTDLEPRTRRALERSLSVLHTDGTPIADGEDPTVVSVVSGDSGRSHTVDVRQDWCTCEDYEYRNAECKHIRRAKIALGVRPVSVDELADVDVDENLGANAPGPKIVASDGGIIDAESGIIEAEADDGAEILEEEESAEWTKHTEPAEQGGAAYWRCEGCGREIVTGVGREHMIHAEECPRRSNLPNEREG